MIQSNNFGLAVVVNNQLLKEEGDDSFLIPWGSEYSLHFENKHPVRAIVKLWIDGEEQSKGGYLINANSTRIIERNSHTPLKFKLIHPETELAQKHGKDATNIDKKNGVVEARFYLAKTFKPYPIEPCMPGPLADLSGCGALESTLSWEGAERGQSYKSFMNSKQVRSLNMLQDGHHVVAKESAPGVTVGGSRSDVVYAAVNITLQEVYTSIKSFLKGVDLDP